MEYLFKRITLRPLFTFTICFLIGTAATLSVAYRYSKALCLLFSTLLASCIIFIIIIKKSSKNSCAKTKEFFEALIPVSLGLIISFSHTASMHKKNYIYSNTLIGTENNVNGVVEEVIFESEYSCSYIIKASKVGNKKTSIRLILNFSDNNVLRENDIISFNCTFDKLDSNNYGFDQEQYYKSENIHIQANGKNVEIIGADNSLSAKIRALSIKLSNCFNNSLGRENGGFVSGILLGRRSDVPNKMNTSFKYLGISHILSVSGLHFSIIIGAVFLLLGIFNLGTVKRYILVSACMLFLLLLTGSRPSVMRAFVMSFYAYSAYACGEMHDQPTSLGLAAFTIVLINPYAMFGASFVLSFSATIGILVFGVPICSKIGKAIYGKNVFIRTLGGYLMTVAVTLCSTVFTIAPLWYFYGEISPNAIIGNLIFIPITTLIMFLSVIMLILYPVTFLSNIAAYPLMFLCNLTNTLSYALSMALTEPISLLYPFTLSTFFLSFASVILLKIFKKKHLTILLSFCLIFTSCYTLGSIVHSANHKDEVKIICANIKRNDYLLINTNKKTLLCDFSNGGYSNLNNALGYSELVYDTSVDSLMLTHLHRLHISSFSRITDVNRIKQIIIPLPQNNDEQIVYDSITETAKEKQIRLLTYDPTENTVFSFEKVKITILKQEYIDRSVQPITVLKIKNNDSFMYAGASVNESSLNNILEKELLQLDHLWLGTHGPNIKIPLSLNQKTSNIFVSNNDVNILYKTSFSVISQFKMFTLS